MQLKTTSVEVYGTSTVNKITPCGICGKYTTSDSSKLVCLLVTMETPRAATTHSAWVQFHIDCLTERMPK